MQARHAYPGDLPTAALLAVLATVSVAQAQAPQTAPAGEIVGVGNFAHIVEDLDAALAFYRGVLGLDVTLQTEFAANAAIQAMGNTPDAESRIAVLDVPGLELGVELIEYRGIDRKAQRPHFVDPGAANLAFRVRGLDELFPAIARFPRVIVEMLDTPGASTDASAGHIVAGAAFEPAVADSEESIRFYNELLGFDFTLGDAFNSNQQMAATAGAPGASFRQSRATIPGTSVPMTLIEFKDIERRRLSGRTQDPGTTVLQLIVRDVAGLTAKLKGTGVPIVSVGGKPVEVRPGLDIAIVRDPNGMLLELVQRAAR